MARRFSPTSTLGSFLGLIGMSVVAGLLVTAAVTPFVAFSGMAVNSTVGAFNGLPEYLQIDSLALRSTIYAKKGGKNVPIATFYSQNRIEDSLDQISPFLQQAAIDTEDPRFYEHGAIDLIGTLRAAISNATGGGNVQGGSSITQQYVKNVRLQTCEKYNVVATAKGNQTQEQAQAALDKKYQKCWNTYTAESIGRKIEEMKLAIGVEKTYTKKEILQGYLNISLFGGQVYGVEAAARYYFNKTAAKVTLPEAATLIAILNNPNRLRIDRDTVIKDDKGKVTFENTKKNGYTYTLGRRNYVLKAMLKEGDITQKQYDAAVKTKIKTDITPQPSGCSSAAKYDAAFYCESVYQLMQDNKAFGATAEDRQALLRHGGLRIYTPLNIDLQTAAQKDLNNWVPADRADVDLGAVNVAMEVKTGRVIQMVQNRPWGTPKSTDPTKPALHDKTQVNYAVDAALGGSTGFQTGSTYKMFTLLDWLEEGHSINDTINAPFGQHTYKQSEFHSSCPASVPGIDPYGVWKVGNDSYGEGGLYSIIDATKYSVNTAFAQMGTQLDLCKIRQTAIDLGVHLAYPYTFDSPPKKRELRATPSSILGVNELAPLTLAAAFAAVANSGVYCAPVFIDKVIDEKGKELEVPKADCHQAIDKDVAAGADMALKTPFQGGGTAAYANPGDGVPLMGKTGTTDDASQNWLVSSTTKVAQATWVGNTQQMYPSGCTAKLLKKNSPPCNNPYWVNFRHLSFYAKDGGYDTGGNVKLRVAKPIITRLNKMYGGDEFPKPSSKITTSTQIALPSLVGKTMQQAQQILTALGFDFVKGSPIDSVQPEGLVAGTSPAAGTRLSKGSQVTVLPSKGNLVTVPDVTGQTLDQAVGALQSAGFTVAVKTAGASGDWKVTKQKPGSGPAKSGATVQLWAEKPKDDSGDSGDGGSGPGDGGGGPGDGNGDAGSTGGFGRRP